MSKERGSEKLPNNISAYSGKDLEAMFFAINYHEWIIAEFYPYLGSLVAEVGAGKGDLSRLLLETGIKSLKAFEPSQNMYQRLGEVLRQDNRAEAINGFLASASAEENYDSVLYVNVLEHIEDDVSELAIAYEALKLNGHLLIFAPALPWLYSDLDKKVGHLRRYDKKDLVNLVQGTGFKIVKIRYFDIVGIIPWYLNFVLLKNSMNGSGVSLYDRFIVPPMRFLESRVPPPVGKNVLLIAKKIHKMPKNGKSRMG